MTAIIALIAAGAAVGFGVEHRFGAERSQDAAALVMRLMLWVLVPPIAFLNLARLQPTAEVVAGIAFGLVALLCGLALAYVVGTRVLRLPRPSVGALMLVAGFANTGYLGLPITAALFGPGELPTAIIYDVLLTTATIFSIGVAIAAAFGTVASEPRERLRVFLTRNPPLWGCVAGLLAPAALSPEWAYEASHVVVYALLPLGFFAVGVTLATEAEAGILRFAPPMTPAVATALGIKLLVVPGVVLGLSTLVVEIPRSFPSQAAMASAINCIVIGHEYGLDNPLMASAITWSTAVIVAAGLVIPLL